MEYTYQSKSSSYFKLSMSDTDWHWHVTFCGKHGLIYELHLSFPTDLVFYEGWKKTNKD